MSRSYSDISVKVRSELRHVISLDAPLHSDWSLTFLPGSQTWDNVASW